MILLGKRLLYSIVWIIGFIIACLLFMSAIIGFAEFIRTSSYAEIFRNGIAVLGIITMISIILYHAWESAKKNVTK